MDAMPSTLRLRLDSRNAKPHAEAAGPAERDGGKENLRAPPSARSAPSPSPSQCVREVERMRLRREALRGAVEDKRRARADDDGTAEFQQMIAEYRINLASGGRAGPAPGRAAAPLGANNAQRIRVVVRKRPLLPHERENADYDTVSCAPGGRRIVVHEPKVRVDLQKAMESHLFDVDDVFPEDSSTQQLYARTVGDLVAAMFDGCSATCFTYGQTGSGKTCARRRLPARGRAGTAPGRGRVRWRRPCLPLPLIQMRANKPAALAAAPAASPSRPSSSTRSYTMLGKEAALAQADAMAPSRPLSAPDDVGLYHLAVRDCFDQLELLRREGVALYLGVSFFEARARPAPRAPALPAARPAAKCQPRRAARPPPRPSARPRPPPRPPAPAPPPARRCTAAACTTCSTSARSAACSRTRRARCRCASSPSSCPTRSATCSR